MYGSAEEIEKRRQQALEKQKQRKENLQKNVLNENVPTNTTNSVSSSNFYGNEKHENKLKHNFNNLSVTKPYQRPMSQNVNNNKPSPAKIAPVFLRPLKITFSFVTEDRFTVKTSSYSEIAVTIFKTIPSKSFDPKTRNWTFHYRDYEKLLKEVQNNVSLKNSNLLIEPIPNFALRIFRESPGDDHLRDMPLSEYIEPKLAHTLMGFQKEGFYFGVAKQGRVLIADEMGLGKTYQAIALADFYKSDWPLLICTTAAMREQWAAKLRELLPRINPQKIICITSGQDLGVESANIVITSYSLMESLGATLLEKKFGVLIMDESHTLKNNKAKRTSVAEDLSKVAKRVILLSGTPALSRPKELYSQISMLAPGFASFKEYSTRYCDGKLTTFGWNADGTSNLEELNLLLKKKFMIRRTKDDVEHDLKEKNRESVILDTSLIKTNDPNLSQYADEFSKSKGRDREEILLKFYSATAEIKIKAVCAYLKTLLKDINLKFIVFAHHRVMLDALSDFMYTQGIDFMKIDGTTKHDIRDKNVARFQNEPRCRVAVLSLLACSAGITLTAAKMVVFAELTWTPSILEQAESRAHRIGQTDDITVKYLLAKGTADDLIWPMLQKKQHYLNKAGLNNEDFSDNTCISAPNSAGNITPYLTKTQKVTPNIAIPSTSKCNLSDSRLTETEKKTEDEIDWGDEEDDLLLASIDI
uniref:CSON003038 protein n=1 Tax=Culicoides sonorensis TaxID=179676 RepID=A0A336MKG9_CULSO